MGGLVSNPDIAAEEVSEAPQDGTKGRGQINEM